MRRQDPIGETITEALANLNRGKIIDIEFRPDCALECRVAEAIVMLAEKFDLVASKHSPWPGLITIYSTRYNETDHAVAPEGRPAEDGLGEDAGTDVQHGRAGLPPEDHPSAPGA